MLDVQGLTVRYGTDLALEDISFQVPAGRVVGVIGPNGAGKSTLLKAMMGLVPVTGSAKLGGSALKDVRERVAYVPQRAGVDWDFPALVKDVVLMGCIPYMGWFSRFGDKQYRRVATALARVKLTEFADRRIGELSGGQQQRAFIARALVQDADLYLFDEPFVGVDQYTEIEILNLFAELRAQGKTLLVVNHDLGDVVKRYDDVLLLRRRVVAYGARPEVFSQDNLNRAYLGQTIPA